MTKVSKKDWRNLNLSNWTVTTFREYMKDRHKDRYGIPYVTNNYAMEGRMIKNALAEYGDFALFSFIDACFSEYTPSREYPGLNFAFMYSYMRERVMRKVLADIKDQRERKQRQEDERISDDDVDDIIGMI